MCVAVGVKEGHRLTSLKEIKKVEKNSIRDFYAVTSFDNLKICYKVFILVLQFAEYGKYPSRQVFLKM